MKLCPLLALSLLVWFASSGAARADVASARAAYEQAEALIAQGRFDEAQKRVARIPRTNDYARV